MPRLWGSLLPRNTSPSTPQAATARATGGIAGAYGSLNGSDVDRQVKQYYERVMWVYRCVDAIATKVSSLPIVFRQGDREIDSPVAQDRALSRVLNRRANSYESSFAARYRFTTNLLLSDRGLFIEVVRSKAGLVSELHVLPAGRVEPIPDPKTFISGYRVANGVNGVDELLPEQVLWIKAKPHPTDPYRQMTPMTAAGISADTDFLARMFNKNFLMNDGRPGLLVTVQDLNPDDADELKQRFSGGGGNAGRTSVIEGAGIDVADMSATPRDAMWQEILNLSKQDILLAFGCPESVLGNSSERTYSNADAEDVGWWNNVLIPHGNVLAQGYDLLTAGGIDDDIFVVHDTSKIDALQQVVRNHEMDLRQQFQAGTITLDQYLEGTGRKPMNVPGSSVVWLGANLMPIGDEKDVKSISDSAMAEMRQAAQIQQGGRNEELPRQGQTAVQQQIVGLQRQLQLTRGNNSDTTDLNKRLMQLEQQNRNDFSRSRQRDNSSTWIKRPLAHKELPVVVGSSREHRVSSVKQLLSELESKDDKPERVGYAPRALGRIQQEPIVPRHPYERLRTRYEAQIEGIADGWSTRQLQAVSGRLKGTKARKGTRHWKSDDGSVAETKELNAKYVVNADVWIKDLVGSLVPVINVLVNDTITSAAAEFGDQTGVYVDPTKISDKVKNIVAKSALTQTLKSEDVINELEQRKATIEDMQAQIEKLASKRRGWRKGLAVAVVTASVEGARSLVADEIGGMRKTWNTMHDEKVRPSHRKLSGRSVQAKHVFRVGGIAIRFPGDPVAPIGMTANCRCYLTFQKVGA